MSVTPDSLKDFFLTLHLFFLKGGCIEKYGEQKKLKWGGGGGGDSSQRGKTNIYI